MSSAAPNRPSPLGMFSNCIPPTTLVTRTYYRSTYLPGWFFSPPCAAKLCRFSLSMNDRPDPHGASRRRLCSPCTSANEAPAGPKADLFTFFDYTNIFVRVGFQTTPEPTINPAKFRQIVASADRLAFAPSPPRLKADDPFLLRQQPHRTSHARCYDRLRICRARVRRLLCGFWSSRHLCRQGCRQNRPAAEGRTADLRAGPRSSCGGEHA